MITRIRPETAWTFDEKLAIVAIGAAGSVRRAVIATKVNGQQLLEDCAAAIRKLPKTDLVLPTEQYAVIWWRGADLGVWQDSYPNGKQPSQDPSTLWHDDYERLLVKYKLARGSALSQIVDDLAGLTSTLEVPSCR